MFLDVLRRRNPRLIEQAIALHQAGRIPANSTVIDLDAVTHNAAVIKGAADRAGLETFAMAKQMGRNGDFCRAVKQGGIAMAVAVDVECARACTAAGLELGHVGHLVQVPRAEAGRVAAMAPRYWTVFNETKAAEAAAAAGVQGREQALLARIFAQGDRFYTGHEGGFPADGIAEVAEALDRLTGGRFAGLTTFPALLFETTDGEVHTTPNLATLARAVEKLARTGRKDIQVNAPGTTSSTVLQILANSGATQCEPGHGLTGTTPLHAVRDLPELPAAVYLSEVSHIHGDRAYCFGGGLYIDPVFPPYPLRAVVSHEPSAADDTLHDVEIPPPAAIDYYGMIAMAGARKPAIGDTVVFGFRQQSFFHRPFTVGIAGLSTGGPTPGAVHDAFGRPLSWPG
jgi:predicted amino acid racemase